MFVKNPTRIDLQTRGEYLNSNSKAEREFNFTETENSSNAVKLDIVKSESQIPMLNMRVPKAILGIVVNGLLNL
jgi:hypothetical protein